MCFFFYFHLSGSTEDFFVANAFGLEEECCSRYGESNGREILRRIFDVFEFLPLCASIEFPKIIPTLSGTTTKSVQKMLLLTGEFLFCKHSTLFDHPNRLCLAFF